MIGPLSNSGESLGRGLVEIVLIWGGCSEAMCFSSSSLVSLDNFFDKLMTFSMPSFSCFVISKPSFSEGSTLATCISFGVCVCLIFVSVS